MKLYFYKFLILICLLSNYFVVSQNSIIEINQDSKIDSLIQLKKEINKEKQFLKIQIFNGSREDALKIKEDFEPINDEINLEMVYETPNYKLWIGNFKTQLQADRNLIRIKKKYRSAFIFRPILKN